MEQIGNWLARLSPTAKRNLMLVAGLAACAVGFWFASVEQSEPTEIERSAELRISSTILVHVTGEVANPGLYELKIGARLSDAIEQAGGFTEKAAISSVNLARLVADGEQILVVAVDQFAQGGDSGYLSLNGASASELEKLPGIGPALAGRIVEYRGEIGSFTDVEQLRQVPGIGPKLFAQIKDQLTL